MVSARKPTVEQRLTRLEKDMNTVVRIVKALRKHTLANPPPPVMRRLTGLSGAGC